MSKTIIFDMDGTLIDSEKYYRIFWPKALAHFGYHMTDEQALQMRSLGRPFAPAKLKEWFGEELDYSTVREYRKQIMEEFLLHNRMELKPGAVELLAWLKEKQFQVAVATATDLERAERYLTQMGIRSYFTHVICAAMVKEGKPAPDIYQYACRQLEQNPEDCIAVEDSPNGVMSAYRAGCKVIMVPDQTEPDELLSSIIHARAECLTDLIPLLEDQYC